MAPGELSQWLSFFVAALSGAIIGAGAGIKWMWTLSDRVLHLESKVGPHSVAESLRLDRHDHVYPMLQERLVLPLDILEAKMHIHDQSLAILAERDRIEGKLEAFLKEARKTFKGE